MKHSVYSWGYGLLAMLLSAQVALADFEDGMRAYETDNYGSALREFRTLADAEDADGMYMLGRMNARGVGVIQDFVQAHKWFNLASARGHRHAAEARERIAEQMTPQQISQAQRLARSWRPGAEDRAGRPDSSGRPGRDLDRDEIAEIQESLNRLGYDTGRPDGSPGRRTRQAIEGFQRQNRLAVTGEPSLELLQELRKALAESSGGARDRGENTSPRVIAAIQGALNELGYDAGPADGRMGNSTYRAITDYQRARRLPVDGQPSSALLNELQADLRRANEGGREHPRSDRAWNHDVLRDNFRDGDYTQNPAWRVAAGYFFVDSSGLRTTQRPPIDRNLRPEDLPLAILGSILDQATGVQSAQQANYSEIFAQRPIGNSFAIQAEISARGQPAQLEFGPYQGGDRATGYRLLYSSDGDRSLSLVRRTRSGSSVIESASLRGVDLQDERDHRVVWTRDESGRMRVTVDGNELMQVVDRGFRDRFDGFTLVNWAGNFGLREIRIQDSE